jgi:hypothetical protein
MVDPTLACEDDMRVRTLTTIGVHVGTRPTSSLPRRSAIETRTIEICAMFSTTEMHVIGLKISAKSETALSTNNMRKGTMITMALTMTSPNDNVTQPEDAMKGGQCFLS